MGWENVLYVLAVLALLLRIAVYLLKRNNQPANGTRKYLGNIKIPSWIISLLIIFLFIGIVFFVFLPMLYSFWTAPSPPWAYMGNDWTISVDSGTDGRIYKDEGNGFNGLSEVEKQKKIVIIQKTQIILHNNGNKTETIRFTYNKPLEEGGGVDYRFFPPNYLPSSYAIPIKLSFTDMNGDSNLHPSASGTFYYYGTWSSPRKIILKKGYSTQQGYLFYPGYEENGEKLSFSPAGRKYSFQFAFTLDPGESLTILSLGPKDSVFGLGIDVWGLRI